MAGLFSKKRVASDAQTQTTELFGTLLAVRHESSGGSMSYRSEFEIEVNAQEIVRCAYWPHDPEKEMAHAAHVPVTAAQWEDVEQTVRTLWPLFREVKPKPKLPPMPPVQVLDGGDYSCWFLTRQTEDGVQTAQYHQPDDRRICTLIALLRELAEPIGREIPRYAPPVLCGVCFRNEKADCSYQCTPWGDGQDGYRLIVYDGPQNDRRSVYLHVPDAVWDEAFAFLEPLRPERFPTGAFRDSVSCTLYYSDGKQKRVVPDRRTADSMQAFFSALTDRVQSAQPTKQGDE